MFRFLLHDTQSHSNSFLCCQTLHFFCFAPICHNRMTSSGDNDVFPKFAIRYEFPHEDHPNLNRSHFTNLASSNALFFCSLHNRMLPPSIFPSLSFSLHSNSRSSTHFPSLLHFSMYSGFNTHNPHATAPRCFSVRFNDAVMKCVARGSKVLRMSEEKKSHLWESITTPPSCWMLCVMSVVNTSLLSRKTRLGCEESIFGSLLLGSAVSSWGLLGVRAWE